MNSDDAKRFCLVTPEALLRAFAAIWIFVGLVHESRAAAETLGLPRGVSDLIRGGGDIAASALSNPNVDGISIRAHWSDVETADGVYNWSYLDAKINQASAAGKWVTLRVSTAGGGVSQGGLVPDWVINQIKANGGKFFSWLDSAHSNRVKTIPVFWDPTFMQKKRELIEALGKRYGDNRNIKVVYVGFANARTSDWNVPGRNTLSAAERAAGFTITGVQRWKALGYTEQKIINSGCPASGTGGIIDAAVKSFPSAVVIFSGSRTRAKLDPLRQRYCAETAFNNAKVKYGSHVAIQRDDLSQKTSVNQPFSGQPADNGWRIIYNARPQVAAQMVWSTNDMRRFAVRGYSGTPAQALRAAVDCGKDYGTSFQEIYQADITNSSSDMQAVIAHAHTVLTSP
jgi:Beta-galactosidase